MNGTSRFGRFLRRPPKLPPRLSPDEILSRERSFHKQEKTKAGSEWTARQQSVKKAFIHAWSGYKHYAMGYDELMPLSRRGIDG